MQAARRFTQEWVQYVLYGLYEWCPLLSLSCLPQGPPCYSGKFNCLPNVVFAFLLILVKVLIFYLFFFRFPFLGLRESLCFLLLLLDTVNPIFLLFSNFHFCFSKISTQSSLNWMQILLFKHKLSSYIFSTPKQTNLANQFDQWWNTFFNSFYGFSISCKTHMGLRFIFHDSIMDSYRKKSWVPRGPTLSLIVSLWMYRYGGPRIMMW